MSQRYDTPIQFLGSFSSKNNLFIKRDDLLPFSFGGNKVRISESFFEDAALVGADCMVSYGSAKSNLLRVMANMAAARNMPCFSIIKQEESDYQKPDSYNAFLTQSFGAMIRTCNRFNVAETVESVMHEAAGMGLSPYYIFGDSSGKGNEHVPVKAYVSAYDEIMRWSRVNGVCFDRIYLASGTGMTQSGLLCGAALEAAATEIFGVSIARSDETGKRCVESYAQAYIEREGLQAIVGKVNFLDNYLCGGYGLYDERVKSVIARLLAEEGIYSDPVYVGKAFSGMLTHLVECDVSGMNVLFIHTGSTPLYFDYLASERRSSCLK